MPSLEQVPYDDRQAAVCQALGMEPSGWQAAGRMRDGRFFWTVQKTEKACRSFVDAYRFGCDDSTRAYSHMIQAQYPDLSDAWALEAMRAAGRRSYQVGLICVVGGWSVQVYRAGSLQGGAGGETLGEAVRDALYFCLWLHRAA